MPRGVYDRGKVRSQRKPGESAEDHELRDALGQQKSRLMPATVPRRCGDCQAFEAENDRQGDCLLNPLPVPKYARQWCMQFRGKA